MFSNMSAREKFSHPYKECFVPLSNRFEIHNKYPRLSCFRFGIH